MDTKEIKLNKGETLITLLIVIFVFSLIMFPIIRWTATETQVIRSNANKEQALQIAEAGINYYQWHLAHFPADYKDGTNNNGPYVHTYLDSDTQTVLGQYSLVVTPPVNGSTIVTITSTGSTTLSPGNTKSITARYGLPSLAVYSFLSNDVIWIGPSETVNGQMQSNNGIRFDGVGNAPIQSAKSTYTCGASQGCSPSSTKNGVWGSASAGVQSFWQFPIPAVDFSSLTANLATLKSSAQSAGIYLPPSNANGYSIVFNSAGTVSVYKVTSLVNTPAAWDVNGVAHNEKIDYNNRTLQYTVAIPANGIIYIEDNTWVEGTVNGRVMLAAAKLPYVAATAPNIYIPKNLVYQAKDGTSVLGLLAQKDLVVTYGAPTNLEIDAALIAQNGSTQFFYYPGNVAIKNSISIYGAIMTFGQWTWTWVNGGNNNVSGYTTTIDTYDNNLLYAPPPSFPLSAAGYKQLSWTSN
ncbi:MAG: pilus assembly PilX N-terminal domain-containing protein [bacterium]